MGIDMTGFAEVRADGRWRPHPDWSDVELFWRDYSIFGFLADMRNYSHSPVIAEPRYLPDDVSPEVAQAQYDAVPNAWGGSWLTLAELLDYDYDQVFWDRRIERQTGPNSWDGAALAEEGEGQHVTLREFLGGAFFGRLDELAKLGDPPDVRIVFWFG